MSGNSTSRLDAAMVAFVALAKGALSIPVYDGPPAISTTPQDCLIVGIEQWTPGQMITAVDLTQDWSALGHLNRDETGTIHAVMVAWGGDTSMTALRARVVANLALVESAARANPDMGGTVLWVEIKPVRLSWIRAPQGNEAQLYFTADYKARI